MSGSAGPNPLLLTAPGAAGLTAGLCAVLLPCSLRNCPNPTISGTLLLCGISAISLRPNSQLITIDIARSSQYSLYILSSHCGHHCLNPSPTQSIPPLLPNLLCKAVCVKGWRSVASSPFLRSRRPHQAKRQHGKKQGELEPFPFTSAGGRGAEKALFELCFTAKKVKDSVSIS